MVSEMVSALCCAKWQIFMKKWILCAVLFLSVLLTYAAEANQWKKIEQEPVYKVNPYTCYFRTHSFVGYLSQFKGNDNGIIYSAGGRFVMGAGTSQRWGLDMTLQHREKDSSSAHRHYAGKSSGKTFLHVHRYGRIRGNT
jgi:hypothetical protein